MHPLHGFLVIDKPSGPTSHDVVARIRRAVGGGKVGHAGTLDPFATGVLVVALGNATRLTEWATAADKRYLAEVTLGIETDTYDVTGQVVATHEVAISREQVELALEAFRGEIEQRPPAFSALQVGGRRLYDAARQGLTLDVPPRTVTIHRLELADWEPPRLRLDLDCSKGTYVRSLAHDLGAAVGMGGHLSALRRTASGHFRIDQAAELDEALEAIAAGRGEALLRPLEEAVEHLPRIDVGDEDLVRLRNGLPITDPTAEAAESVARVHGPDGELAAFVEPRDGAWWPSKVLAQ